jgi:CDP-diacylglycerol--glycerol-3-phosphate 3-phosphatidyltransferase
MSLPDALVVFRALAGFPILFALGFNGRVFALALFALAALSDALDGWLARRSKTATDHGALLDPLADKALVLLTLAGLWLAGAVPLELVAAIAVREVLVSGLRLVRYRAGEPLPASPAAKAKTALEMTGIAVLIVARPPAIEATIGVALLAAALAIGVVTLPSYLSRGKQRYTTKMRSARGR